MSANPIRIRARPRGDLTEVMLLMPHPMESGYRKNESGAFVAAHYITDVTVRVEGRTVLQARLSQAVSQDPLLTFRFRGAKPGDRIEVNWTDSRGDQRGGATRIAL